MFSSKTNNSDVTLTLLFKKNDKEMAFHTLTFLFVDNTVGIVTFL